MLKMFRSVTATEVRSVPDRGNALPVLSWSERFTAATMVKTGEDQFDSTVTMQNLFGAKRVLAYRDIDHGQRSRLIRELRRHSVSIDHRFESKSGEPLDRGISNSALSSLLRL